MGIIHLEYNLIGKLIDIFMMLLETVERPVKRGRDKEVLLLQTKLLSGLMGVVGIEDIAKGSGEILILNSLRVISPVKGLKGKLLLRLSVPDHEGIYHMVLVTNDRNIIGYSYYGIVALLNELRVPVRL